jgi:hypothetical protein
MWISDTDFCDARFLKKLVLVLVLLVVVLVIVVVVHTVFATIDETIVLVDFASIFFGIELLGTMFARNIAI